MESEAGGAGGRQQLHVKGHLEQAVGQHQALLGPWPVSPAFQRTLGLGRSCVDCRERWLCLDCELQEKDVQGPRVIINTPHAGEEGIV